MIITSILQHQTVLPSLTHDAIVTLVLPFIVSKRGRDDLSLTKNIGSVPFIDTRTGGLWLLVTIDKLGSQENMTQMQRGGKLMQFIVFL